jgi:alginate O-acetyltransferase complex protein AlgJ
VTTEIKARAGTRLYAGALVVLFAVGISLPLADWKLAFDSTPELVENRVPAPKPQWPHDPAGWRALPKAIELYWNDAFGLRRRLIRWQAIAKYRWGISPTPFVVVGKGSWLFYGGDGSFEQHRGLLPLSDAALQNWTSYLEARRDWLARRGAHFLLVIAPDKQSVYPEEIPARYGPMARTPLDQLEDYLSTHSKVDVLDLRAALLAAKADGPVFLSTDTHWNDHGAFVGYTALMERLRAWYPQLTLRGAAGFHQLRTGLWNGDMALMYGLYDVLTERSTQWAPTTPLLSREVDSTGHAPPGASRYVEFETPSNPAAPRAVVFHDSFFATPPERQTVEPPAGAFKPQTPTFYLRALMAESFSHSAFTWQYDLDPQLIEREHPDVVIEEMVERRLLYGPIGPLATD